MMVTRGGKLLQGKDWSLCSTRNRDVKSKNLRMKAFLSNLVKGSISQEIFLKDIKANI